MCHSSEQALVPKAFRWVTVDCDHFKCFYPGGTMPPATGGPRTQPAGSTTRPHRGTGTGSRRPRSTPQHMGTLPGTSFKCTCNRIPAVLRARFGIQMYPPACIHDTLITYMSQQPRKCPCARRFNYSLWRSDFIWNLKKTFHVFHFSLWKCCKIGDRGILWADGTYRHYFLYSSCDPASSVFSPAPQ